MPYSRATIELWLSGPPMSVTTAAARANNDVQAGVVMPATSTSPGCSRAKSAGPSSTRATPVTRPLLAPIPVSTSPVWSVMVAGIIAPIESIQVPCGSSCGGVARR